MYLTKKDFSVGEYLAARQGIPFLFMTGILEILVKPMKMAYNKKHNTKICDVEGLASSFTAM